jgi:hypothetical protein
MNKQQYDTYFPTVPREWNRFLLRTAEEVSEGKKKNPCVSGAPRIAVVITCKLLDHQ